MWTASAIIILFSGLAIPAQSPNEKLGDWKALASYRPRTETQKEVQARGGTWTVHRIEDGVGDINLDYYPIKISVLPTIAGRKASPSDILEHIRKNLNNFVDTSNSQFEPYKNTDAKKWLSTDPNGALLLIRINLIADRNDDALVVTSKNSPTEWIFSTVRGGSGWTAALSRDNPGAHPVSGNRVFGIQPSSNSWIIYTRGADRATRPMDIFWGIPGAKEIGFQQADKLWKSFQGKVADFVNQNGGKAEVDGKLVVSKRINWDQIKADKDVYDVSGQPAWERVPPVRK